MIRALIFTLSSLVASPLQAQTAPSVAAPKMAVEVRFFGKDARKPVPFESVAGLILFRANVAGQDVWMLIDNGSDRSVVDSAFARRAGMVLDARKGAIHTPAGTMPYQGVEPVALVIPGQFEMRAPLTATDLNGLSAFIGRKVEGIIGLDLLSNMMLIVASGRHEFQMMPSGRVTPPFPGVDLKSAKSLVEVTIGNERLSLALDMGMSSGLSLRPRIWDRVKPKDASAGARYVAGADGAAAVESFVSIPSVMIGPFAAEQVEANSHDWPEDRGDGQLGMGLLGRFDFVLDIGAGKLWLSALNPGRVR